MILKPKTLMLVVFVVSLVSMFFLMRENKIQPKLSPQRLPLDNGQMISSSLKSIELERESKSDVISRSNTQDNESQSVSAQPKKSKDLHGQRQRTPVDTLPLISEETLADVENNFVGQVLNLDLDLDGLTEFESTLLAIREIEEALQQFSESDDSVAEEQRSILLEERMQHLEIIEQLTGLPADLYGVTQTNEVD